MLTLRGIYKLSADLYVQIADVVPQGSFTFFTPTIVTGLGYKSIQAQLLTVYVSSLFQLSHMSSFSCSCSNANMLFFDIQ